jgi:VWFA-related protein
MPKPIKILVASVFLLCSTVSALELEVRVSGEKGSPIQNLEKLDFSIQDGGTKSIDSFRFVGDASETKIYVAVEASPNDFPRVKQAIESFVSSDIPTGVEISLGGTPFTSDREVLKGYIATGIDLHTKTPGGGLPRLWNVGTLNQVQGDAALAPYIELAAHLSGVPGKKAVALFRPDLRLDRQGLDTRATAPRRQNRKVALGADVVRSQQVLDQLQTVALFSRSSFYPAYTGQDNSMNQPGLNSLAQSTSGRALLGTNDPKLIFDMILEDAGDYYVLGYSPELQGKNARHSVKVSVSRKGTKVRAARSYLDIEGLGSVPTPTQSPLELSSDDASLPVQVAYAFFRGDDGKPLMIATAGVDGKAVEGAASGKGVSVDLTAAGGVRSGTAEWSASETRRVRRVFDKKGFAAAQKKGGVAIDVSFTLTMPAAGWHEWKLALRDENATKHGIDEQRLWAPDFAKPLATSTMLLTRRAVEAGGKTPVEPWGELLDYEETRFVPESGREFRAGETVLFTYRLYNPPQDMLGQAPEPQIALLRDEEQIGDFQVSSESRIVDGKKEIQYMGALRTDNLEPGEYIILSAVPGRNDERQPYVEAKFRLVAK